MLEKFQEVPLAQDFDIGTPDKPCFNLPVDQTIYGVIETDGGKRTYFLCDSLKEKKEFYNDYFNKPGITAKWVRAPLPHLFPANFEMRKKYISV